MIVQYGLFLFFLSLLVYFICFFFAENAIKGNIYLYMLELFAFQETEDTESEKGTSILFQQNTAPSHFSREFRLALNVGIPGRLIGRSSPIN
jgi:hypothetical protein